MLLPYAFAMTDTQLFVDKAQLFPGCTFLVGIDTAVRIVNPKYYSDSAEQMAAVLARRLIERGRAPSTPVVMMANVSRTDEQREVRSLGYLAGQAPTLGEGPVLIGIGEVFAGLRVAAMPVADETMRPATALFPRSEPLADAQPPATVPGKLTQA